MKDNRLFYRVLLKIMGFSAMLALLVVFIASLFPDSVNWRTDHSQNQTKMLKMDLLGMKPGDIKTMRWDAREIGILKRRQTLVGQTKEIAKQAHALLPALLESGLRSIRPEYFVYFNTGDSGNCPLFHDETGFKDICTQSKFDNSGRETGNGKPRHALEIPPHYFNLIDGKVAELVVGRWPE